MSALAQLARWGGEKVSGSDRYFDAEPDCPERRILEREGIAIHPQDGSGVAGADEVVVSAAVERGVPDYEAAVRLGIPVLTRSRLLARMVRRRRALAVAGTNGKSTTAAFCGWILSAASRDPSLAIGACLKDRRRGLGNALRGEGEWFCFEADESDRGLVDYRPEIGVVTGITADHHDPGELERLFTLFAASCSRALVVNADCPRSAKLATGARRVTFGFRPGADWRVEDLELSAGSSSFRLRGRSYRVPMPGVHNALNAAAALAAAELAGVGETGGLDSFPGLIRRMETVAVISGIRVVDDYAHNPAKLAAALETGRLLGRRLVAVYQPHGFAPTWNLRNELAAAFAGGLRKGDNLILLPVYYAGGTVARRFGADGLAELIRTPARVEVLNRQRAPERAASLARPGDAVLVMGARDPGLGGFAREIAALLGASNGNDDEPA